MARRTKETVSKSDIEALERMAGANLDKLKTGPKPTTGPAIDRVRRNIACKASFSRAKLKQDRGETDEGLDDGTIKTKEFNSDPVETDDLEAIPEDSHGLPAEVIREVELNTVSLLDDPEALARQEDRIEYFYDRDLSISSARRARERRKKEEEKYMFENIKPEDVPALVKRICTFKANNDKVDQLVYTLRKFKGYANDATKQLKLQTDFYSLPDSEKLQAISRYGVRNPVVHINSSSDQYFWDFIKEIIQTCFPLLTFKRTRCNPAAFSSIILEEIVIPLCRIKEARPIWGWFSNRGDRLQKRMAEKMSEIIQTRISNEQAAAKS